jgi:hypothetical protein
MEFRPSFLSAALILVTAGNASAVSFNDEIRPILADRCFSCHGPDSAARKADLRLDQEDSAKGENEDGLFAIVPGKPDQSVILHRLESHDPDEMMPPPDSNLVVTPKEIALIRQWISKGAGWELHWAFLPPEKVTPPAIPDHQWPRNEIDHYVLQALTQEGLKPSSQADRARLLRRLSFDLTGLPPTIAALDAFLTDQSETAYEEIVDKLLASPSYGERLALEWLDVARYGDTDGLFVDHPRQIYPWRDWVVRAFNANLPYRDFITWQLAGDLLPDPSEDQLIATGFLRNNPTSNETGLIDEDYRIKYLVDRVNTTSTAFLGLTMECAQCHDHKFDPITQREYYEFAGFFNSLVGKGNTKGATAPTLRMLPPEKEQRLTDITSQLTALDHTLKQTPPQLTADFTQWLARFDKPLPWHQPTIISNSLAQKPSPSYELIVELAKVGPTLTGLQVSSDSPGTVKSIKAHLIGKKNREIKLNHHTKLKLGPDHQANLVGLAKAEPVDPGETLKLTITGDPVHVHLTGAPLAIELAQLPVGRDKQLVHYRGIWPGFAEPRTKRDALTKERTEIEKSAVVTMIAADEAKMRPTHILMRGEYDKPGKVVEPSAPASIMAFPDDLPANRLGLAHWIVDPANPLTARVAVNRYWQMFFGAGIVPTSEDFGTQGARPSHRALLDHLAVDFVASGWDLKLLLKKFVMSASYRQTSVQSSSLKEHDPANRYLSRAPRQRLAAELLRDHALSVSGLLVDKPGGPGIHPYQPASLFGRNAIGSENASFKQSTGENLYRRSLYTYLMRQVPAANMRILGADGRTICRTRRERTNTPLQALVLLNDPQFVEAARALAERALKEGGATPGERVAYVFRLATSREIKEKEASILLDELADRTEQFKSNPGSAKAYLAGGGERKPDPSLDPVELAAYAAVSSLILNLDEAISKS